MKIVNLQIENFRGIQKCNIDFPQQSRVLCLIGAGDSTKSTLLKAIEWVLWPSWNLAVCDNDFFNSDTQKNIVIRASFTEFSEILKSEDKYGFFLRRLNAVTGNLPDDEPEDGQPYCLTIELTIDSTLEPKWNIVCNHNEPKTISYADRKLFQVGIVGEHCDKDLVWGKNSILQKYSSSKTALHEAYTTAIRSVVENADLTSLDDVSEIIKAVGKTYGVHMSAEVKNRVLMQNGSFSSMVGIFDGAVPFVQKGRATQRLLSIGLNIQSYDGKSLLLIDEIETGLEPYRLRNLIQELKRSHSEFGQVIFTTHSSVAVAESSIEDLLVIHSENGVTTGAALFSGVKELDDGMQSLLRTNPEAFLSKKILVCEGKTELGFTRALDAFLKDKCGFSMAYAGICCADGGGSTTLLRARQFYNAKYSVAVLMDSDLPDKESDKQECRNIGISVFDWDQSKAFEEQIFNDVPEEVLSDILDLAVDLNGIDKIRTDINKGFADCKIIEGRLVSDSMAVENRDKLASVAKKGEWFKQITKGEKLGTIVFGRWDKIDEKMTLVEIVKNKLIPWICNDD